MSITLSLYPLMDTMMVISGLLFLGFIQVSFIEFPYFMHEAAHVVFGRMKARVLHRFDFCVVWILGGRCMFRCVTCPSFLFLQN